MGAHQSHRRDRKGRRGTGQADHGKTIALRWNGKNNGDLVLDRLAELLAKKYPTAKVVKTYRDMADQNLNKISATQDESMRIVKAVASVRPDIVIASQAD